MIAAYRGTASYVLEKETVVPPLRIKLDHVLELKLTRILLRLDHGNSVFERLKKTKREIKKKKKKIK